ncbi:MAG: matrixin family metalloprotease [Phycisphaerales bacterium]|nr:matrixin family metalloprotease [Phycisphaerales bacterium]
MNRKSVLIAACTTFTMIAGAATGAQINNYPAGVGSLNELELQDLARTMIGSLPEDHQKIIAKEGGIGSEMVNLDGFTRNFEGRDLSHVPRNITALEYADILLGGGVRDELAEHELNIVNNIATLMDEGKEVPFMCFSPDTNPKYAYTVNELLDYQFVEMENDDSRFQQGNRWSRTAVDGNGLSQGDVTTITYSFVPDGTFVPNSGLGSGNSTLFAWLDSRYASTAIWQGLFEQVFDRWAELTGLTYIHETNDDGSNLNGAVGIVGTRGDVRIAAFNYPADGNGGVLAYNFFPNDGDMAIDAFDTFYNNTTNNSLRLRNVISHEHGHGLGMEHVCPANQTKLMEPFISTAYVGPQLDDILNGQRHYGDPQEPNNSLGTATDLGTYVDSGFFNINEASIDDNSDVDFYTVTVTDRTKITFVVGPNAGTYQQGPQTQSCNSGSNTNYNAIHDLKLQIFSFSDLFNPVAEVDATGTGGSETIVYDAEDPGAYLIIVSPDTNTNNIQRYLASMILSPLPPVVCPPDLNGDGQLNFFDVSAYLTAFGNMDNVADFNGDGQFNFFDVSAFLSEFSAGCP